MGLNDAFKQLLGGKEPTETDTTPVLPNDRRVIGKIIKVSDEGWGFISSKDIKFTRIFFHWTSLKQDTLKFTDLRNGMKVEFTPVEVQDKGFRAIKIVVVKDESKATS
jgi:cold shock CspA family protein